MSTHTLVLVRHATAVAHSSGGDRTRSLSPAGLAQARALGRTLAGGLGPVGQAVCSTAQRTVETLEALAESLDILERWRDDDLYLCDAEQVLDAARAFDEDTRVALVVGHEPSISWASQLLAQTEASRELVALGVPTATAVLAHFEGSWSRLPTGGCLLEVHHEPRRP